VTLLTVKELAAFLGMTESGVRQVIRRKGIERRGTGHFGAALYQPRDVFRHTGTRDRLRDAS
jgi:hypothetical protein